MIVWLTFMGVGWESSSFWLGSKTSITIRVGAAVVAKNNHSTTITTTTNNTKVNCHFEDGRGSYYPHNNVNGQRLTWNYNGTTTTTRSNFSEASSSSKASSSCIYHNYLDELLLVASPSSSQQSRQQRLGRPMIFVSIGDSLDRMTVGRLCQKGQFDMLPHVAAGNTAPSADQSSLACQQPSPPPPIPIQTNHSSDAISKDGHQNHHNTNTLTLAFFKIYGMVRNCSNRPYLQREDSRTTNSTVDRLERYLLAQLPMLQSQEATQQAQQIVVMVGSALWDVSEGCNHQVGITQEYAQAYRQAILNIRQTLQRILPPSTIFLWRTNPQIGQFYSRTNEKHGWGRTRGNIETLNQILRETTKARHEEDILVDWWALSTLRDEQQDGLGLLGDGRHPTETFSLVFTNMVWNAVFSHYPELLIPTSSLDLRR